MAQYWLKREDKMTGPFSGQQLKQMAAADMIVTSDMISADQINWQVAGHVKGLFPGESTAVQVGDISESSRPEAATACSGELEPEEILDVLQDKQRFA